MNLLKNGRSRAVTIYESRYSHYMHTQTRLITPCSSTMHVVTSEYMYDTRDTEGSDTSGNLVRSASWKSEIKHYNLVLLRKCL